MFNGGYDIKARKEKNITNKNCGILNRNAM
jgi:hypothetical protein